MKNDAFSGYKVAGALDADSLNRKLAEVEADVEAKPGKTAKGLFDFFIDKEKYLYLSTAHTFGFIPPLRSDEPFAEIVDAGRAPVSQELKGTRLNVTLNTLRVAHYPGSGTHRVLIDFSASNQLQTGSEEVHFNNTYRVAEGQRGGIKGYPIFVGLTVATEGLGIRCYTVNVKNDDDEALLSALDSDAFKTGLKLATVAQPALVPLSGLAIGLTKAIAGRNRNVPVQDIFLGLDFTRTAGGARLALGSYIVLQIPERNREIWDWSEWTFKASSAQVVSKKDQTALIPYNYFIFGISQFGG